MARGAEAKTRVIDAIREAFGNDFIGEIDKKVYVWAQEGGELDGTQMVQHTAEFGLEEHHQGQKADGEELVEYKVQGMQLQKVGGPGDQDHGHDGLGDAHGIVGAQQGQQPIDQKGDHDDIHPVTPAAAGDLLDETLDRFHIPNLFSVVNLKRA